MQALTPSKPARKVATRFRTLGSVDGRTAAAKRALEIEAKLTEDVSGGLEQFVTEREKQLVRRAAMLGALAEHMEACMLAGEPFSHSEYLSTVRAQHKALEALGLPSEGDGG